MKARKKPVVVDVFHVQIGGSKFAALSFLGSHGFIEDGEIYIRTLEGTMHVSVGDYIIEGVNGELYPCKPDIFEKTYEVVKE